MVRHLGKEPLRLFIAVDLQAGRLALLFQLAQLLGDDGEKISSGLRFNFSPLHHDLASDHIGKSEPVSA
jgi:hypothetical protein